MKPEKTTKSTDLKEDLQDYERKDRPSASDKEQAEGDEEIVDEAIRNQEEKSGDMNSGQAA